MFCCQTISIIPSDNAVPFRCRKLEMCGSKFMDAPEWIALTPLTTAPDRSPASIPGAAPLNITQSLALAPNDVAPFENLSGDRLPSQTSSQEIRTFEFGSRAAFIRATVKAWQTHVTTHQRYLGKLRNSAAAPKIFAIVSKSDASLSLKY